MKIGTLFCFWGIAVSYLGVPLWGGLSTHTAQALATKPVSAPIPHASQCANVQVSKCANYIIKL